MIYISLSCEKELYNHLSRDDSMGRNIVDEISDGIHIYLFLTYVLPVLLLIAAVFFGYQFFYGIGIRSQYKDQSNIIFTSKFNKTLSEKANEFNDKDVFSELNIEKYPNDMFDSDINIEYRIIEQERTIEEYDKLVKNEITKWYNFLKDKKIVIDNSYEEEAIRKIRLVFDYDSYFDDFMIEATGETCFKEDEYQKIMNSTLVMGEHPSISKYDRQYVNQ